MSLTFKNRIEFDTSSGEKAIELFHGDLTTMPASEKVDMLMVSAFHGDYTPTKTSLIGALSRNLLVKVGELAKRKEEDLRRLFHCWWSEPLADHLPFRRILCFESSRSGLEAKSAVQAIFKALVPASSLFTNGVIVSPLLSTGNQHYDESEMLKAIVDSAVLWMQNGLNIKLFKLVIYRGSDEIWDVFQILKRKHNRLPGAQMRFKSIRPTVPKYDFYLSFANEERKDVETVKKLFLEHKQDFRFFSTDQWGKNGKPALTPESVFDTMKTCTRVIAFLSPSYLEDDDRVEEYNAAWCLNRKSNSETRLAPMLCQDISGLPTYMSLIQWVDIRLRDGRTEKMIRNVTLYVVSYVQEFSPDVKGKITSSVVKVRKPKPEPSGSDSYDIFISYAHANEPFCKLLVEQLTAQIPDVKIFIDREELRTGGSWQEKLYHALESSRVTIALLSQAYIQSRMCDEEFLLSIARHFTDEKYHLLPIQIEPIDVDSLADRYTSVHTTVVEGDFEKHVTNRLVPAVNEYLRKGNTDGMYFPISKLSYNLTRLLEDGRCSRLVELIQSEPPFDASRLPDSFKIQILCANQKYDADIAHMIKDHIIHRFMDSMNRHSKRCEVELSINYDTPTNVKKLDEAALIVVLVSTSLLEDADLIAGLQIAINRQRYDKDTRLYPVLLGSSLAINSEHYHAYCELLLYDVCLTDPVWTNLSVDEAMKAHDNYKTTAKNCDRIQEAFARALEKSMEEGTASAELELQRAEKNIQIKQAKFVNTVCNRIFYHISYNDATGCQVLVDTFEVIKKVVLEKTSVEKKRAEAIKRIGAAYDKTTPTANDDNVEKVTISTAPKEPAVGASNVAQRKPAVDEGAEATKEIVRELNQTTDEGGSSSDQEKQSNQPSDELAQSDKLPPGGEVKPKSSQACVLL